MPEPLSIETQIVGAIRRITRAVDMRSRRLVDEHGLTGPQLMALVEAARLGRATVSQLARAVYLSQPTVTGIVDRLERRGLLTRSRDGSDRRTVNVAITQAGMELLNKAPSLLQDRFRNELRKLKDWEQTSMLAALQRIAEMMECDELEPQSMLFADPDSEREGAGPELPAEHLE